MTRSWMALGLAALVALMAAPVWAQSDAPSTSWWRPYVGVGYTWGGQTIFPAKIQVIGTSTTYDEDISAGAGLDLRAGLQLRPGGGPFGIKASVAQHSDGDSGLDGWDQFHRMPLELAVSWAFSDRLNVGVGVRHSIHAQLRSHWDSLDIGNGRGKQTTDYRYTMNAKPGFFGEVEWMVTPSFGLQARVVRESFRLDRSRVDQSGGYTVTADYQGNGTTYRADHFGLMLAYYFR